MSTSTSPQWTGYGAAWIIVFVWSFWLIVSRIAEDSGLTIYDLAALRYGLACVVALPLCIYYRAWEGMSLYQIAVLSFILGPIYILSVFSGFLFAPAAHGGIFMNGILPLVGIVIGFLLYRAVPGRRQLVGGVLILVSAVVLAWDGSASLVAGAWKGDLLFVIGAVFFSFYMILSERWKPRPMQIIFCGTVVNAAIYLPVWVLFLPSGMADAPAGPFWLQAIYQGFVPNLIGLLFVAHASRTIGNGNTAVILAAVPAGGAVLGAILLGETLGWISITALALLTLGLLIATQRRKPVIPPSVV
ncbi:Integral membrane protein [Sulfitobacter noctilucae]|uniref:DMT family transporter n=1 Tax=Sulfitobacter noctilucae TaxID=1342302 RepID=UPI00046848B7|nr:DMT family transporter [Sulfitobacter noctilucae]KIN61017.1 Integral membrane protein [Sulfitobacter noctilucae]